MNELFVFGRVGVLVGGLAAAAAVSCGPSPGSETGGAAGTTATGTAGAGGTSVTTSTVEFPTGTLTGGGPSTGTTGLGAGGQGGAVEPDLQSLCSAGVGGGSEGGAGGAGGADCSAYPAEGQGTGIGSVLPPTFTFPGYPAQSSVVSTISLANYFDCDGSKGINALYVIESATWCRPCQEDAEEIGVLMKGRWKDLGIQVVTLMVHDADFNAATTTTALQWRNAFDLGTTAVGIDPDSTLYKHFCPDGIIFFPFGLLIDPRTMKVVSVHAAGGHDLVEALALQNEAP